MYTGSEAWSDSFCIPFVGMIRIRFYGYNLSSQWRPPCCTPRNGLMPQI